MSIGFHRAARSPRLMSGWIESSKRVGVRLRAMKNAASTGVVTTAMRKWIGRSSLRALVAPVLISAVLTSCMVPPVNDSARVGPFFKAKNHTGDPQLPATLRRVVLLPIAGGSVAPAESSAALDPVFSAGLQKENRFEVVALTRADCLRRFQAEEFLSTGNLPHDFMAKLRREYGADAVMFIDLTSFKPYRPMILGVRAKLATLGDEVRLVWSFDNIFSAADPTVANSARHHFIAGEHSEVPADLTPAVLQSPSQFAAYAAAEMFATLPPVYASPASPAAPSKAK